MARSDYAHWNEEQDTMWWLDEGRWPDPEPDPDEFYEDWEDPDDEFDEIVLESVDDEGGNDEQGSVDT